MVDLWFILETAIGTMILAAIVLIGSHWSTIVSVVSRLTDRMTEEGAARQAYRQGVYNMSTQKQSHIYDLSREPEPLGSDDFSLLNGEEPEANGSSNPAELALNAAEVAALHRMIEHNKTAAKPSKSSTIQAGFGVSRGGSSAYTRASLIYDMLFGAPAPAVKYRRTPEQDALRQQLGLEKP